jgi:hypothetical protein
MTFMPRRLPPSGGRMSEAARRRDGPSTAIGDRPLRTMRNLEYMFVGTLPVDVVTEPALSPYLRARILAEAKPLAA